VMTTLRELTNHDGDIVWAATYRAWGATQHIDHPAILRVVQDGNTVREEWIQQYRHERPVQNLRFQGQYFDEETGLHYNGSSHKTRLGCLEKITFINMRLIRLSGLIRWD